VRTSAGPSSARPPEATISEKEVLSRAVSGLQISLHTSRTLSGSFAARRWRRLHASAAGPGLAPSSSARRCRFSSTRSETPERRFFTSSAFFRSSSFLANAAIETGSSALREGKEHMHG